jgi:CRISPR/Cas system-associated exonuclease Cas4 (RecB family)
MRISRSKIEIYIECPRCFYFDVVLKKSRPSGFPLNLNIAVDKLLKREFDNFREKSEMHPLQTNLSSKFIPANHQLLEAWREPFKGGVSFFHPKHQITYFGAIDDLWINEDGDFAVVDYKATAKESPVTELPEWASSYQRQISFYSYLLKKNNLPVYKKGFLVYTTALTVAPSFNNELNFTTYIIELDIDESWIEPTLNAIYNVIQEKSIPSKSQNCKYCNFIEVRTSF